MHIHTAPASFSWKYLNSLPSLEKLMIDADVTLTRRQDLLIVASCDSSREFCTKSNRSCQEPLKMDFRRRLSLWPFQRSLAFYLWLSVPRLHPHQSQTLWEASHSNRRQNIKYWACSNRTLLTLNQLNGFNYLTVFCFESYIDIIQNKRS